MNAMTSPEPFAAIARVFVYLICALCALSRGYSQPQHFKDLQPSYYAVLESLQGDSLERQTSQLRAFIEKNPRFAEAYHTLLEWWGYHGRIDRAEAYYSALAQSPNPAFHPNAFWMLAKIAELQGGQKKAYEMYKKALKAAAPPVRLLRDFIQFDWRYFSPPAGENFLNTLRLPPDLQKIISAFYVYYVDDNNEAALSLFEKLPQLYREDPAILNARGYCYYYLGKPEKADSTWHRGIALSRQSKDPKGEAEFLWNIGFCAYAADRDFNKARDYFTAADSLAQRFGDYYRMQMSRGYLGYLNRDVGDLAGAEKQFQESIGIGEKLRSLRELADFYKGYGMTLYYQGKYDSAFIAIEKSLENGLKSGNLRFVIETKLDQGGLYVSLGQPHLARRNYQEALELSRANPKQFRYYQELAQGYFGQIYIMEGEYQRAREVFQNTIRYLEGDPTRQKEAHWWIERVGKTYLLQKEYDRAETAYQDAYRRAAATGEKNFAAWYLMRAADMQLHQDSAAAALSTYGLAREIVLEQNYREFLWELNLGYGNAYQKSGQLDSAIAAYTRSAKLIEANRRHVRGDRFRVDYFVERYPVYEQLVNCYRRKYDRTRDSADLDSLYFYFAGSHNRALRDLYREGGALYSPEDLQALGKVQRLQRQLRLDVGKFRPAEEIAALSAELETARLSLLARRLRAQNAESDPGAAGRLIPELGRILEALQESKTSFLLYHITDSVSFALAAAGEQVKVIDLPLTSPTLRAAVDALMKPFHHVQEDSLAAVRFHARQAFELYEALLQPVLKEIDLEPRLLIIADTELMDLPFEMLLTRDRGVEAYTPADPPDYAGDFLLKKYTIMYSPMIYLPERKKEKAAPEPGLLLVANPFNDLSELNRPAQTAALRTGWRFDPLPYAELEAANIQQIYPQSRVLKQDSATRSAVVKELSPSQILHFSTHGFVDSTYGAFSGLVLALEKDSLNDDGFLMGYEILDLNLDCDLVTLSACETGRGKVVAGEGVLGLQRLFLGAGAKTVLMSLWKVHDRFAAELMPDFYRQLLIDKKSKPEALALAKRTVLNRKDPGSSGLYYQHPFFWATFALYGDPGVPSTSSRLMAYVILFFVFLGVLAIVIYYRFMRKPGEEV